MYTSLEDLVGHAYFGVAESPMMLAVAVDIPCAPLWGFITPPQRVVPLARRPPGGGVSFCRYRRDGMKLPHPELGRNCATALARVLRLLCTELPGLAKTGSRASSAGGPSSDGFDALQVGRSCGHATGRCQPYPESTEGILQQWSDEGLGVRERAGGSLMSERWTMWSVAATPEGF